MSVRRVVIVGGGAAGFFAALACADAGCDAEILLLEKSSQFLSKVRISGGGRCNVTHACFDAREFATRYPRGEQELIGALNRFSVRDTVEWFAARGVPLKTEGDGRMFPTSDRSQTIMDCLLGAARRAGVKLILNCGVDGVMRHPDRGFELELSKSATAMGAAVLPGQTLMCDRLLLAIGGCRTPAMGQIAVALGHALKPPVPSLFTLHIAAPWMRGLAGVSLESAEVSVADTALRERGPLLVTHTGLSGPVILRLSAWGARELHGLNYQFPLRVNWLPHLSTEALTAELQSRRLSQGARRLMNTPLAPLPARLWEQLVSTAGIQAETRCAALPAAAQHALIRQLQRTELQVTGKSLNKDEFVTCGGVRLSEVNFKTMESRVCPGLFFAGEVLDIDGITGGFNFQAAWTTGWIAGRAMATH